jgi:uncharacterized membrane protein
MSLKTENLGSVVELETGVDSAPEAVFGTLPEAASLRESRLRMEKLMGTTLLVGVLASTFLVLLGGIVYVSRNSTAVANYRVFQGDHSDLRTLHGLWEQLKLFSGKGIIQFGLLCLVGLQVLRVMLTGLLFFRNRDWVFVMITTIVLILLAYGLGFESTGVH